MKIGELSRQSGLSASAIRFYEEEGLLAPISRTAAGYREYADNAVYRLGLIRAAKEIGFSLDIIRTLLAENGKCSISKTLEQTRILLDEVEARQRALAEQRQALLDLRGMLSGENVISKPCRSHFDIELVQ
jgi:MerR family copper efflux transcriptional regulator